MDVIKMRDIKFRGLSLTGEWVYGNLIKTPLAIYILTQDYDVLFQEPPYYSEGMGCGLEDRGITDRYQAMEHGFEQAIEKCFEEYPDFLEVAPETVGQYTGFHAENGVEIYDGDIVKDDKGFVGKVLFNMRYGSWEVFNKGLNHNTNLSHYLREAHIEVIGNIHQNPELLSPTPNEN